MRAPSLVLLIALLLLPGSGKAQDPSGTDIWVFRLSADAASVDAGSAIRVTERLGYDNQPHFAPGNHLILYTAIDSVGQADIFSYNLDSGERKNVTRSHPESEYSATVMPSLTRFSAIRVEADSTQRLWSFESGGTNPALVLPHVAPVGYHAWLSDEDLALFVLGSPATLQIASVTHDSTAVVAENIGRSLHAIPGDSAVSFVQWNADGSGSISRYGPGTRESAPIAPLLDGNEFYAWTPGGVIIMGQESKLFRWVPGESGDWEEIADLASAGLRSISRLAVSRDGRWVAVVAEDGGSVS
jgi:WD40 repeat protein